MLVYVRGFSIVANAIELVVPITGVKDPGCTTLEILAGRRESLVETFFDFFDCSDFFDDSPSLLRFLPLGSDIVGDAG